ncbi:basic proline-rich protein-like isoform X1 [Felis catus]|uniref:basic proline-rich protein-like isoform X1 n=1 Tax=Felis catus TaxID=9685 RepID=UPI001D1A05A6|nr:basic proline-rich protein-like isoform X1 [Felis catus]
MPGSTPHPPATPSPRPARDRCLLAPGTRGGWEKTASVQFPAPSPARGSFYGLFCEHSGGAGGCIGSVERSCAPRQATLWSWPGPRRSWLCVLLSGVRPVVTMRSCLGRSPSEGEPPGWPRCPTGRSSPAGSGPGPACPPWCPRWAGVGRGSVDPVGTLRPGPVPHRMGNQSPARPQPQGLSYLGPAHLDPRPCSAHGEGGHRLQAGRGRKGEMQTPRRSRLETEQGRGWSEAAPARDARGPQTLPPPPEPPPPGGVRPCPPWSALWSQSWWRTHSSCPRCPGGSVASGLRPPGPRPRLPLVSSLTPLLRPLTSGSKPHMRILARTCPQRRPLSEHPAPSRHLPCARSSHVPIMPLASSGLLAPHWKC